MLKLIILATDKCFVSADIAVMYSPLTTQQETEQLMFLNPLNAELNPICHLLALLGGATILVVSRVRVK